MERNKRAIEFLQSSWVDDIEEDFTEIKSPARKMSKQLPLHPPMDI